MEIQKFEAYKYRGKKLDVINRKEFINEISDIFASEMFGYNNNGTSYYPDLETLNIYLHNDETGEDRTIKLDLSDMGIEIGHTDWYDEEEAENHDDLGVFVPERNLDLPITKAYKSQKGDMNKFNI